MGGPVGLVHCKKKASQFILTQFFKKWGFSAGLAFCEKARKNTFNSCEADWNYKIEEHTSRNKEKFVQSFNVNINY